MLVDSPTIGSDLILRVSRTIADLAGAEEIQSEHGSRALPPY